MTKITDSVRDTVRKILENSKECDPATMRISATGFVSAKNDPDKTLKRDARYYRVAHVDDMLDANGVIREGW